jgi:hypothetical protein
MSPIQVPLYPRSAVDASGIYWTDSAGGVIGHANLDGTGERAVMNEPGLGYGIAVGSGYLYWTYRTLLLSGAVGRALESGADPNPSFITGLNGPCGAAMSSHYLYFADGLDDGPLGSRERQPDRGDRPARVGGQQRQRRRRGQPVRRQADDRARRAGPAASLGSRSPSRTPVSSHGTRPHIAHS